MTYNDFVLSMSPIALIDWTENPLVNLGTDGGETIDIYPENSKTHLTEHYTHVPVQSAVGYNEMQIVSKSLADRYYSSRSFSIGTWVRFTSTAQTSALVILRNASTTRLYLRRNTNKIEVGLYRPSATWIPAYAPDANWFNDIHHVMVVRSGSNIKLYIDGVMEFDYTASLNSTLGSGWEHDSPWFVSTPTVYTSQHTFFDRALTHEEIMAQYTGPTPSESWTLLENGLEVPLTAEGVYEGGSITPVTVEGLKGAL